MIACVSCSNPNLEEYEFCTSCGWPQRQPSPYGEEAKLLPVTAWADAPSRDRAGRPLAYDADPRSGRAYIPGANPLAIDKIPDFPTSEGAGARRNAEVNAGGPSVEGVYSESGTPLNAALGAGRLVWTDGSDLLIWNLVDPRIDRKSLSSFNLRPGKDALLTRGWKTYLRTEQGILVHDGLSGNLSVLTDEPQSVATFGRDAFVAASGINFTHWKEDGTVEKSQCLFPPVAVSGTAETLAAFGKSGETALFMNGDWKSVQKEEPNSEWAQGWIVNGQVGIRTTFESYSKVRYIDPERPTATVPSFSIDTDGPVSVIPGRNGFEGHRLLGFVGGGDPRISIYHPGESLGLMDRRPLGISSLGPSVSVVRRYNGLGTIMVAVVDQAEAKVVFNTLRDTGYILPPQHILPPNTVKSWLIPHAEGLIVLSFDGRRSIANSLVFPA